MTATERRLAVILSADVAAYSRLMAEDEAGTIRTLTESIRVIWMRFEQHCSRVKYWSDEDVFAEVTIVLQLCRRAASCMRSRRARSRTLASSKKGRAG